MPNENGEFAYGPVTSPNATSHARRVPWAPLAAVNIALELLEPMIDDKATVAQRMLSTFEIATTILHESMVRETLMTFFQVVWFFGKLIFHVACNLEGNPRQTWRE